METMADFIQSAFQIIAGIACVSVVLSLVCFALAVRKLRNLDIPPDADFTTTLLAVPIYVVLAIDLLDFGLDIFATPIVWVVLDRLNLKSLRNISAVEALIPFTNPIPTLTIAWVAVRLGVRF